MRTFFLSLLTLVGSCCLQAQTAKECFLKMPEEFFPYLTATNRADMPDFLSSNMQAKVKNRFDEQTQMLQLTDDYLSMMPDSASLFQIKLLPLENGQRIIAMAYTLKGPAADSDLSFYTTEWKKLPADSYFQRPSADDFFLPEDSLMQAGISSADSLERNNAYRTYREAPFMEYIFSTGSNELQIVPSLELYLDEESRPRVLKYIRKSPLIWVWKNGRFERKGIE